MPIQMNKTVKLSEIADVRPGYLGRQSALPKIDGTYHLLQLRDFNAERTAVDISSIIRFNPEPISSVQPLQFDELIFLARGSNNFAFAPSDLPSQTIAAGYFFVIHPHAHVHPAYLAWYLNQPATLRAIARAATSGAHMPVVRRADIENVEVLVPPQAVQRIIVELDNLMREEQSLLHELARKKQELISTACMTVVQSGKQIGDNS